jgi:hypothetical protein
MPTMARSQPASLALATRLDEERDRIRPPKSSRSAVREECDARRPPMNAGIENAATTTAITTAERRFGCRVGLIRGSKGIH